MYLKKSLQQELDFFYKAITDDDCPIREVTKGALTQARAKLNPYAFTRLTEVVCDTFYSNVEWNAWMGLRVLAIDGSRIRLPNSEDIKEEFHTTNMGPKTDAPVSLGLSSMLYDVLNHVTLDAQLASWKGNSEKDLLVKHLDKVVANDMILADRYYASFETFYLILSKDAHFCFRMKNNWWIQVKEFVKEGLDEKLVTFSIPKTLIKKYNIPQNKQTITCRLINIELENGNIEVLCTSLIDMEMYQMEQFHALYHKRWNVEEAYKLLKSRVEVESFSGLTARSVYQDFHSKILLMNLCTVFSYTIAEKVKDEYAKEKTGNKHSQQINKTHAISKTKEILIPIFFKNLVKEILNAFDKIIEKTREIIRPNRKVKRNFKAKKIFHTNYKGI